MARLIDWIKFIADTWALDPHTRDNLVSFAFRLEK